MQRVLFFLFGTITAAYVGVTLWPQLVEETILQSQQMTASLNASLVSETAYMANSASPLTCSFKNGDTANQLASFIQRGCTLILTPRNVTVTLATTTTQIRIPSHTKLVFETGSVWVIGPNTVIILEGTYEIPLTRNHVFFKIDPRGLFASRTAVSASGTTCTPATHVAYPEWFGAIPNDSNDDSMAINKALELGNNVHLQAGTYDVKRRLLLDRSQTLRGSGKGITKLVQDAQPVLLQWDAAGAWRRYGVSDFLVGLVSDCSSVSDVTLDMSKLTLSGTRSLTNFDENNQFLGLVGIQISMGADTSAVITQGIRPIQNISVKNVDIIKALTSGILIFSSRSAQNVLVDGVSCQGRPDAIGACFNSGGNTGGNNMVENVTIRNSTFTGSAYPAYLGGGRNYLLDNVKLIGMPETRTSLKIYTGDTGDPITVTIRNSQITNLQPKASSVPQEVQAVISVVGRPLHDGIPNVPFMTNPESSVTIENSSIISSVYSSSSSFLIPLIRESIGTTLPINIKNSTFTGGSFAILAADPENNTEFGGYKLSRTPPAPLPKNCVAVTSGETPCDFSVSDIAKYKLMHSRYILTGNTFSRQAISAIRITQGSLVAERNIFSSFGMMFDKSNRAGIELIATSTHDTTPSPRNVIVGNFFSLARGRSAPFLKIERGVFRDDTTFSGNSGSNTTVSFF